MSMWGQGNIHPKIGNTTDNTFLTGYTKIRLTFQYHIIYYDNNNMTQIHIVGIKLYIS